jgi:hypothetical protein
MQLVDKLRLFVASIADLLMSYGYAIFTFVSALLLLGEQGLWVFLTLALASLLLAFQAINLTLLGKKL